MNKNIFEGNWEEIKGKAEARWGKLTNNPTKEELGDEKALQGYLQKQYGWDEERAKREFNEFIDEYNR